VARATAALRGARGPGSPMRADGRGGRRRCGGGAAARLQRRGLGASAADKDGDDGDEGGGGADLAGDRVSELDKVGGVVVRARVRGRACKASD